VALKDDIQAISDRIANADANTKSWAKDLQDLNALRIKATDPADIARINTLIDATKELRKERKDGAEEERRNLETLALQNKTLIALIEKLKEKHEKLAIALTQGALAAKSLVKEMDLGKAIQHFGAVTPYTKNLGLALGFVVGQAIKFQDRIQVVNKSIIDLSAATGHYAEGLKLADSATLAISEGFAQYGQRVGIASQDLQKLAGNLGQVGFSMEEMGIDKQTGKISSLSDAVGKNAKTWGALSASVGIARVTGLEQGQVISQLQTQIKTLGGNVEGTVKSFASLSLAAGKSRLSTATLLPILQSMQSSFKFLGLDSSAAAEMIGKAGQVAEKAGVGAGAAVEVMGKAIAGMAQMDFGQMAFFGQQMGMGGGLAAGFQFRQKAGGTGGAEMAQQIGQVVGRLMGGTGEIISEGQAATNDQLAAIRLGQEKFAAQTFGFSQNDARAYLNLIKEMEQLDATGQGSSKKAEETRKTLKDMELGEAGYRAATLTAQEKIARILELIGSLVGRVLLAFIRGVAGGAGAAGGFGKDFSDIMTSISTGKGLDTEVFQKKMKGLTDTIDNTVVPTVEGVGKTIGRVIGTSWVTAIGTVLGGVVLTKFIGDAFGGMLRRALGGTVERSLGATFGNFLGRLIRLGGAGAGLAESAAGGVLRSGGTIAGGAASTAATGWAAWGAKGAAGAGEGLRAVATQGQAAGGVLRLLTMNVTALGPALKGALGSFTGGIGTLLAAIGPVGWIALTVGAAFVTIARDIENSALQRRKAEEAVTGAMNKHLLSIQESTKAVQKHIGLNNEQAYQLYQRAKLNTNLLSADEKRLWNTRRQSVLEAARGYTMTEETFQTSRHTKLQKDIKDIENSYSTLFGVDLPHWIRQAPRELTGEYRQAQIEDVGEKQKAEQAQKNWETVRQAIDQAASEWKWQKAMRDTSADQVIQERKANDAAGKRKTAAAAPTESVRKEVVVDISEKNGLFVNKQVRFLIAGGVVAGGPAAFSSMRHDESEGYSAVG
jgi:tetrahydromethanopterin S-methyltransferase subunit G